MVTGFRLSKRQGEETPTCRRDEFTSGLAWRARENTPIGSKPMGVSCSAGNLTASSRSLSLRAASNGPVLFTEPRPGEALL